MQARKAIFNLDSSFCLRYIQLFVIQSVLILLEFIKTINDKRLWVEEQNLITRWLWPKNERKTLQKILPITTSIGLQAEEAYSFILRHINKATKVEGVYSISRWEYPIKAIREIVRNAIVHRQYSLIGKDIKIAIYDDMVEITSPGLLPPSIDFSEMESRQSDAVNKVIDPVFKKLGIIDQWGNGLKLVADEMKEYPDIQLCWKEVDLSFQIQFINKKYNSDVTNVTNDVTNVTNDVTNENSVLDLISKKPEITTKEISEILTLSERQCKRIMAQLKDKGIIERIGTSRMGHWTIKP